jgi:hypothetical protein
MTDTPDPLPAEAFIVDDQGLPVAHVDLDQLTADAIALTYELAATAGDDPATDQVAERWAQRPDFTYLCAAALTLMTKNILGPTLDACDAIGLNLRAGLARAADDAHNGGPL